MKRESGKTLHLVGLGDVGGTLLTGLMLCGGGVFSRIGIFDPDEARCARYEQEMGQILAPGGDAPRVEILSRERLFEDCDAFAFTASAGVPPAGADASDVRMMQYGKNRAIIAPYAAAGAAKGYGGLFFQISDPVDLLCRAVFDAGLPAAQIVGCGLGVMRARAAYCAQKRGVTDFLLRGRVFGPHGVGLVAANAVDDGYDDALSRALTEGALSANLRVRETGYKPYIAPGLSSGLYTILAAMRGEWFDGAAEQDGVWFGGRMRLGENGIVREETPQMHPLLAERVRESYEIVRKQTECAKG